MITYSTRAEQSLLQSGESGDTYYWRLGHHHNGTAHDLTTIERAIRGIGLGQSITPRDGL